MDKVSFAGSICATVITGLIGSFTGLLAAPFTQVVPENSGDKREAIYIFQAVVSIGIVTSSCLVLYNNIGNVDLFSIAKMALASFFGCFNMMLLIGPFMRIK